MAREGYSVASLWFRLAVIGIACAGLASGCSTNSDERHVLSELEAKQALRKLPYRFKFRLVARPAGAVGAVAGRAYGPRSTVLNFGISLGDGTKDAVPVPKAGTFNSFGYPGGGFLLTNDLQTGFGDGNVISNPRLKSTKEWNIATDMSYEITEALCQAATGEPCPI